MADDARSRSGWGFGKQPPPRKIKIKMLTWTDHSSIHIGFAAGGQEPVGRSLDPPHVCSRDIQTPRPCEPGDFRAGGDAEGDAGAVMTAPTRAIMIAPTIPDVPVFGHGRRAGSEHDLETKTRPCTGGDEAASAAAPEASPNDPRNSARCQITRRVEGGCIRGRGGSTGLTMKRPEGTFWGMDTQHGPSHSDHMEDRMRYSGYFEMRNEKLREQGLALRREDDASSRAIASVYHNLAARLIENCPAERNKMALEDETRSHKRPRDEMDENGGGKARAGLSTWWESSCGHTVRLLRPKGKLARSDVWQVRVYGPSVVEQNGYKSLTCRANLEAALNKAARYLKVPVNDLVSSKEKKASGLSLPSRTESTGAVKGMEGACENKQNNVDVGGKPLVEASKQAASRSELWLFKGKVVYFDGRTGDHSALHLSKLVMLHGGACSVTLLQRKVTHVICENLSGSKTHKAMNSTSRVKYVRPEWILDSIKHGKILREDAYLVVRDPTAGHLLDRERAIQT